ncbi:hypothetical protein ACFL37_00020 [Candidatus Margulisiibacteriota bacterium]
MVFFLAAVPVAAVDFNDEVGTELWMIQTSGSSTDLGEGEGFFGNPPGGPYTDGTTTIQLGVWGLLGLVPPDGGLTEDPYVQNLTIGILGSDILLDWESTLSNGPFYVWRRVGGFENAPDNWVPAAGSPVDTTSFTDPGQVGVGAEEEQVYYRVISSSSQAALNYKVAVGKVNHTFGQGNNYFNCPFVITGTLSNVIGAGAGSIPKNCQVLDHDRATDGFISSLYDGLAWQDPYALALGKSYVFFNNDSDPLVLTMVGAVNPDPASFSKTLAVGNTYFGLPFPLSKSLDSLFGANPIMNDNVLIHDRTTDGFVAQPCNTDGAFAEPAFELTPATGYVYYRNSGQFDWQPRPEY